MDLSMLGVLFYVCCAGTLIPIIITGSVYGAIAFIPETERPKVLAKGNLQTLLIIIFVLAFVITCAILLYATKDFYAM